MPGNARTDGPTLDSSHPRSALTWPCVILLYVLIQCVYWRHHIHDFFTRFVGEGYDNYVFVWNAWWLTRCIHSFQNPFFCDLQYAPHGTPLAFHCLTVLPALLIAGLSRLTSIQLAHNVVELGLCVLGGAATFALCRRFTQDLLASAVGGAVFMLCPFMTSKLLGHMNLSCAALLPLYTLVLFKAIDDGDSRSRRWLIVSFLLILLSSEQTLIFAANVTVWYWMFRGFRTRAWKEETIRFLRALTPILVIGIAWGCFLLYEMIRYRVYPERHGPLASCPEPLSYLLPIDTLSVWRHWFLPPGSVGWALRDLELATYLGWFVFPVAVAGLWLHRDKSWARAFALFLVLAMLISLGPKLQWHRQVVRIGRHGIHLPMDLYQHIPLLGMIGQSGRYMVIAYMGLAVGVAGLLTHLRARLPRTLRPVAPLVVLIGVCLDYAYEPITCAVPIDPVPPGAGRVMEFRVSPGRTIYRQTIDGRALVGGYISRPPAWIEKEYCTLPGIGWFYQPADRRGAPPQTSIVNQTLRELDVEYVWVSPASPEQHLLESAGWRQVWADEKDTLMQR